ncbi:MAG: GNAT family N-acetyltransferase [Deltaproteobacteria bacterium]|nr:GNAT family N-acetyltransferase [Deltaproteobacteria bacterium]
MREDVSAEDPARVRRLVESTGFFSAAEVDIAEELVLEALARGDAAGYFFCFASSGEDRLDAYACYGPIPCTASSYDLYWIAVRPQLQGLGLGRELSERVEQRVAQRGGTRLYADTSGRAQYEATRRFYEHCGYHRAAVLSDFYAPADDKIIYVKVLDSDRRRTDGRSHAGGHDLRSEG